MGSFSSGCVLTTVLAISACSWTAPAHSCDINSIDPACGYISQNPANINSLNNPANPNSPLNLSNPSNPASLNNPNNPSSPLNPNNQPLSGVNISNPYSTYNLNHPESPYSALNPNNPSNLTHQHNLQQSETERRRHQNSVHYKDGFGGLFSYLGGGNPAVVYWRGGVERECRLRVDCPRSVYVEGGAPVPDQVASEPEDVLVSAPHRERLKRHRSGG